MRHALIAVLLAASPLPAAAHAILIDSQPASGATIAPGPTRLVLRFNSRIDQGRSRLELRRGGAKPAPLRLAPSGPDTLQADATLAPGAWTVRWQVLAIDGHITRGDVPLTVQAR
jgi:methionine-rich copper-binding protein CopC